MKTNNNNNTISKIVRLKQLIQRWRRRVPPPGTFAVYVGVEHCRFVIPIRYFNLPVIQSLLDKAEEEFGYQPAGGFVLSCDVEFFKKLLNVLKKDERGYGALGLDVFTEMFSSLGVESLSSSSENVRVSGWLASLYCGRKLGFERWDSDRVLRVR